VPIFVADANGTRALNEPSQPIGIYQWTKPAIAEIPIAAGTCVVVASDGVPEGGERFGHPVDLQAELLAALAADNHSAQAIADHLLAVAMAADRGRPADDMSVLVVSITANPSEDGVRRMSVRFPIP
jgi:serine phosphatase RsbU (regulator of sigma subunit)